MNEYSFGGLAIAINMLRQGRRVGPNIRQSEADANRSELIWKVFQLGLI